MSARKQVPPESSVSPAFFFFDATPIENNDFLANLILAFTLITFYFDLCLIQNDLLIL